MEKKQVQSDDDKKIEFVKSKYGKSKDYYRNVFSKFRYWDDLFLNTPRPKSKEYMSNLFIPATHKAVMTLLSRVVNNTFSIDPNFDVVPSNQPITNLLRSQMYQSDFFNEWVLFCMQLLVRGTSISKITWSKRVKKRYTLEKMVENVMKQTAEGPVMEKIIKGFTKKPIDKVKYDGPVFETIDLVDFYPEPNAVKITDGTRIFRSVIPMHEYLSGNYKNKDFVKNTEFPGNDQDNDTRLKQYGLQMPVLTEDDARPEPGRKLSGYVELLEAETRWYNKKTDKMEPWLITVANREAIAVDKPFPYWNTETMYVKGTWIPRLNEFYGLGIGELVESLQEELNDKHNQRIDNVNQILMPVFQYEEGAVDPKYFSRWERKPGAKLRMRPGGITASKWDYAPDVTAAAILESNDIENYIEEVSGAVRSIQPSSGGGDIHRTSSGLMLLQSMAHERIKLNLSAIERDVLEPVFEKFFEYNLQFLGGEYKIFNPDGKETRYTPDMLIGDFEFRAKGSRYALDQQMKVMNLSRVISDLAGSGLPLGELHIRLWMRLYDALGFEDTREIEEILRQEVQKAQQMAQAAAQAEQGGQGGDGNIIRDMTGDAMGMDMMRSSQGQNIPGGQ